MRLLLAFFIGFFSFFYLAELLNRFKLLPKRSSFAGFLAMIVGVVVGVTANSDPSRVLTSYFLMGSGLGVVMHHFLTRHFFIAERLEKNFVKKHDSKVERFLEILPGALTWIALTSPIWLSFTLPFAVAYIIILADVYWLISSLRIAGLIFWGFRKYSWAKKQDWLKKLKDDFPDEWSDYYHIIALPTYKESIEVLAPAFDAVVNSNYDKKKIFLAVGMEAWDSPEKLKITSEYLKELNSKIGGTFATIHELQEGEIKGPATNRNCIIRNAVKELSSRGIKPEQVIVTTLDADFVIHHQFLAGALHKYLSTPKEERNKRSFTGVFFYYNNYWQASAPMRLIAAGTSFWQLAEMAGSDKYMNFASLSMNLQSLLDIGLWIPNKVNDDSGFYWKAYFHFKGDYKVLPHFLPISGDTVLDTNLVTSFQNQYQQLKRWAYGVEHIPFIVRSYFNSEASFWDKTDKLLFAMWGYLRWGTLALFVTFASLVIPYINPHYSQSVVAYNLPVISSYILTVAFVSLFATIFVHEKTVPPRPKSWSWLQKIFSYIQWVLIPIIMVTISTIPAIDAQTSLMLGRYIGFRTTNKARVSQ